ncbi:MAG: cysteine desulfurase [Bdellovibrionaceae bacterium]|jgi:cysteine desulfurase|nr:cysteine desulfurase [Pseudobdellovibrionaceae bacterium]
MPASLTQNLIYFDNNATTPLDPKIYKAMEPYLKESFGNPSSAGHAYGWETETALSNAREQVASLIGSEASEIYWTSGATESNNMALLGICRKILKNKKPVHMLTSQVEHKAVLQVAEYLEDLGVEVTYLSPNSFGQIELSDIEKNIKPHTVVMSFMFANNEVGSLNPIFEMGQLAKKHNILFHVDAAQATGKVSINVKEMNIDLLSISAHKLYGPKGSGALYVNAQNDNLKLEPLFFGGSQEKGLRPGTQNVAGAVGLGKACELCEKELSRTDVNKSKMRDYMYEQIIKVAPDTKLNGHACNRLPTHLSLTFYNVQPFELTAGLMGIACSSTSACSSGQSNISYVLEAIGLSAQEARNTLRFGLGRFTKMEEIDILVSKVKTIYANNASGNKDLKI